MLKSLQFCVEIELRAKSLFRGNLSGNPAQSYISRRINKFQIKFRIEAIEPPSSSEDKGSHLISISLDKTILSLLESMFSCTKSRLMYKHTYEHSGITPIGVLPPWMTHFPVSPPTNTSSLSMLGNMLISLDCKAVPWAEHKDFAKRFYSLFWACVVLLFEI